VGYKDIKGSRDAQRVTVYCTTEEMKVF